MRKLFLFALISSITLLSYATPPVSLLSFDVSPTVNGRNALIQWTTEGEVDNHYFEVQRSRNGVSWVKVGIVKATETASATNYYEWIDRNPPSGMNHYRIMQVDYDETTETFGSQSVFIEPRGEFSIYPVPSTDYLTVSRNNTGGNSEITEVRIHDITGKLVYELSTEGKNQESIILTNLPLEGGTYLLSIHAGGEWIRKPFVSTGVQ